VYIGIDIGGTHMRTALVDSYGTILKYQQVPTDMAKGAEQVSRRLTELCRQLAITAADSGYRVRAIGLGVAGKIDPHQGRIIFSPNLMAMNDYPLAIELQEQMQLVVYMENDANAFGLGEQWLGSARDMENWLGITLGTGVGGCLMLGGQLWNGDHLGYVAEIGHTIIDPHGPECLCGLKGCLEAHSSGGALVKELQTLIVKGDVVNGPLHELYLENNLTAEKVYQSAKQGNAIALRLFERMGWALGIALANSFSLLGIRHAVIGGGVSTSWDLFIDPLQKSLKEHCSMLDSSYMVVKPSAMPNEAATLGAARLAQIRASQ